METEIARFSSEAEALARVGRSPPPMGGGRALGGLGAIRRRGRADAHPEPARRAGPARWRVTRRDGGGPRRAGQGSGVPARVRPGRGGTRGPARPRGCVPGLARRGPCRNHGLPRAGPGQAGRSPAGAARRAVAWSPVALGYFQGPAEEGPPGVARYAWGEDYHAVMRAPAAGAGRHARRARAGDGGADLRGHRTAPRARSRRAGRPGLDRQEHDAAPPGARAPSSSSAWC